MYKYSMVIDGTEYKALFADHFEAADFMADCERYDDSHIVVNGYTEVTAEQIMADADFEYSYRVEMVAKILLPNAHNFKKWSEQETELKRLGLIA